MGYGYLLAIQQSSTISTEPGGKLKYCTFIEEDIYFIALPPPPPKKGGGIAQSIDYNSEHCCLIFHSCTTTRKLMYIVFYDKDLIENIVWLCVEKYIFHSDIIKCSCSYFLSFF